MSNHNQVTLVGRLGKNAETTPAGETTVTKFNIAVTTSWDGGEKTNWFPIVIWGERGVKIGEHLKRGMLILVSGSLSVNEWKDKETGQARRKTEVIARQIEFLESKKTVDARNGSPTEPEPSENELGE